MLVSPAWGGEPCLQQDSTDRDFCQLDDCPVLLLEDEGQRADPLEHIQQVSLAGLDLLIEGLQGESCHYNKLKLWLPSIIKFFITDINLSDSELLDEDEKNYINFINIILKHLRYLTKFSYIASYNVYD